MTEPNVSSKLIDAYTPAEVAALVEAGGSLCVALVYWIIFGQPGKNV